MGPLLTRWQPQHRQHHTAKKAGKRWQAQADSATLTARPGSQGRRPPAARLRAPSLGCNAVATSPEEPASAKREVGCPPRRHLLATPPRQRGSMEREPGGASRAPGPCCLPSPGPRAPASRATPARAARHREVRPWMLSRARQGSKLDAEQPPASPVPPPARPLPQLQLPQHATPPLRLHPTKPLPSGDG